MSDPLFPTYPRQTFISDPEDGSGTDTVNYAAVIKRHPDPRPDMSVLDAFSVVQNFLANVEVVMPGRHIIAGPRPEDRPVPSDHQERWFTREQVFGSLLPVNFVAPTDQTSFFVFGPDPWTYADPDPPCPPTTSHAQPETSEEALPDAEMDHCMEVDQSSSLRTAQQYPVAYGVQYRPNFQAVCPQTPYGMGMTYPIQSQLPRPTVYSNPVPRNPLNDMPANPVDQDARKSEVNQNPQGFLPVPATASSSAQPVSSKKRKRDETKAESRSVRGSSVKRNKTESTTELIKPQVTGKVITETRKVREFSDIVDISGIGPDIFFEDLKPLPFDAMIDHGTRTQSFGSSTSFTEDEWKQKWSLLIRIALSLRSKLAKKFEDGLEVEVKMTPDESRKHPCFLPNCKHISTSTSEQRSHGFVHVANGYFCPGCMNLFSRVSSVDRHIKGMPAAREEIIKRRKITKKEKAEANKGPDEDDDPNTERLPICDFVAEIFHYWDHKDIYCFYFLGALESCRIPSWLFQKLARRELGLVYANEATFNRFRSTSRPASELAREPFNHPQPQECPIEELEDLICREGDPEAQIR